MMHSHYCMTTLRPKWQEDFEQFLDRLKSAKERLESTKNPSHHPLHALLSKEALVEIYDYFLKNLSQSSEERSEPQNSRFHAISTLRFHFIRSLRLGEAYRLAKECSGLARTLNVLRDNLGEFYLFVETKSKLKEGEKQELIFPSGRYKSGKPVWRVDLIEEYFNLVMRTSVSGNRAIADEAASEVFFSNEISSPEINKILQGPLFQKGNEKKISLYSKKAKGDLCALFTNHEWPFSKEEEEEFIFEILKGTKQFHDKRYVHQDLKLDNILFYEHPKAHVKLADFGFSAKKDDIFKEAHGSYLYQSPEIAYTYSDPQNSWYHYYHTQDDDHYNEFGTRSLGTHFCREYARLFPPSLRSHENQSQRHWLGHPHPANDMWAIGIMVFEIRHKRFPEPTMNDRKLIKEDPLLKGLLHPNRKKRFTVDRALKVLLSQKEHRMKESHHSCVLLPSFQHARILKRKREEVPERASNSEILRKKNRN